MSEETSALPGGTDAQAAEYVLGLLPEAERAGFEAVLAQDADLRQDVVAWTEYLTTLADPIPEVAPPPQLLRRIEIEAFGAPPPPLWRQAAPYALGAVAAAVLSWGVHVSDLLAPDTPMLQATLAAPGGAAVMTAGFDPDAQALTLTPAPGRAPGAAELTLWLVPDGAAEGGAVSLGPMRSGETVLTLPPALARGLAGGTLVLRGDAPEGGASGAELARGRLR